MWGGGRGGEGIGTMWSKLAFSVFSVQSQFDQLKTFTGRKWCNIIFSPFCRKRNFSSENFTTHYTDFFNGSGGNWLLGGCKHFSLENKRKRGVAKMIIFAYSSICCLFNSLNLPPPPPPPPASIHVWDLTRETREGWVGPADSWNWGKWGLK